MFRVFNLVTEDKTFRTVTRECFFKGLNQQGVNISISLCWKIQKGCNKTQIQNPPFFLIRCGLRKLI